MPNVTLSSGTLDSNGLPVLQDNSIYGVLFYNAGSEAWDRSGGGSASWAVERSRPNDAFVNDSLSSDKWSFFSFRGASVSGTFGNDRLRLGVESADARGGITSEGLWSLTGDFDVRLYLDETYYYNEYRSNASAGLTISISDSYKIRISKYFDGSQIGYMSHMVEGRDLKTFRWFDNGTMDTTVGESVSTVLSLVRVGETITPFVSTSVGLAQVGNTVSGTQWAGTSVVEIEVETEQYNTHRSDFIGFTVSGTLETPTDFSSLVRGPDIAFPERSLLLVDGKGLSILDDDTNDLWMRFDYGSGSNMFRDLSGNVAAANGKVYYTASDGLYVLDFPNDVAYRLNGADKKISSSNISGRNFSTSFNTPSSLGAALASDSVNDVAARVIENNEFVALATTSGINLVINDVDVRTTSDSYLEARSVDLSSSGRLFWNSFDSTLGRGDLSFYNDVTNLVGSSGNFSRSGFYDKTTSPVSISSEIINDVDVKDTDGLLVVLGHTLGIDFIEGTQKVTSYGPLEAVNPVEDISFSNEVGVSWVSTSNTLFPKFDVFKSTEWFSEGSSSLKLAAMPGKSTELGDFSGVRQTVDLTGVDRLYFDVKLVNNQLDNAKSINFYTLELLVGSTILISYDDSSEAFEKFNQVVDVSDFSGDQILIVRIISKQTTSNITTKYFFLDNFRVLESTSDFPILPFSSHSVLEVLLLYEASEKKIYFSSADGYGAVDIVDGTLDFSENISAIIPLSSILSADYTETINEV